MRTKPTFFRFSRLFRKGNGPVPRWWLALCLTPPTLEVVVAVALVVAR